MRICRLPDSIFPGILILAVAAAIPGCGKSPESKSADPASKETAAADAPKGPQPKAVVSESEFNFGVMEVGEEREHVFTIKNEGDAKLTMVKDKPGCKCTSFEVDKLELEPGETAQANVKWKIDNVMENFAQNAPLTTNDPAKKEIKLWIKGEVAQLLKILPGPSWPAGDQRPGMPLELSGFVMSPVLDEFEIKSIESSTPVMTAKATPIPAEHLKEQEMKSGYKIDVTISEQMPIGEFHENLQIHTSAREGVSLKVEITARKAGPIKILGPNYDDEHMVLRLGTFSAAAGKKATLHLFTEGAEELKIEEVMTVPDNVKVSVEKDAKFQGKGGHQKYLLTFEVPPGSKPDVRNGERKSNVQIKTNDPEIGTITIRLSYTSTQ